MPSRNELKEILRNSGVIDYDTSEDALDRMVDDLYNEEYKSYDDDE